MNSVGWIVGHLAWHGQRYWLTRAQSSTPYPVLNEVAASGGPATTPALAPRGPYASIDTAAAHLGHVRTMRSSKHASREGQGRGGIIETVSIRERPAEAEDRAVPGQWEGDLIRGSKQQPTCVLLVQVDGKDTGSVVGALTRHGTCQPK